MEDVLAIYERPDDPRFPVVCFDERPCVLHGQPVKPLHPVPAQSSHGQQPAKPARPHRESSACVRQGTACLLATFEPDTSQRVVEVSIRRTGSDYCHFLRCLATAYPRAKKAERVHDNLTLTPTPSFTSTCLPPKPGPGRALRVILHAQRCLLAGRVGTIGHRPPVPEPANLHARRTHRPRGRLRGKAQRPRCHRQIAICPRKGPY